MPSPSPTLTSTSTALDTVTRALDALSTAAEPFRGLFPSVLEVATGKIPFELPDAIEGQRPCDRSFPGSNLTHDHVVLKLMLDLDNVTGESRYAPAVERYLRHFAEHCTCLPTGLFPWGEHSFWNLMEDRPGSSYAYAGIATMATHDHQLQAPAWLWERLWSYNAEAVERFMQGLSRHFLDVENPPEYNRHANLLQPHHLKRNRKGRSCDFPRYSGLMLYDWCFAYGKTGSPLYRSLAVRMADYWWDQRQPGRMLKHGSWNKEFEYHDSSYQTLSLAVSLLEAAGLVEAREPELAATLRERGNTYLDSVLAGPHDPAQGLIALTVDRKTDEVYQKAHTWGGFYGGNGTLGCQMGLLMLCAYRINGDQRLLDFATALGGHCATTELPTEGNIQAKDAGINLSFVNDLFSLTGEQRWLARAQSWVESFRAAYCDHALPRGATGIDIYESQLLPGHLLRGLARTALQSEGRDIGPDYTHR